MTTLKDKFTLVAEIVPNGKQHRAIETIKLKKNYVVFASQIVPKKAPRYVKRKKMDDKENTSHIVFLKR